MNDTARLPYWLDYLARERTMCALCHKDGKNVRIGPPIPADVQRPGRLSAHRNRQRASMILHVTDVHPGLSIRWKR